LMRRSPGQHLGFGICIVHFAFQRMSIASP
jgi:hypothetical protein